MSKQLRIEKVEATTLVKIAYTGGGEVPDALKGAYTNRAEAELAIKRWKAANPDKEVVVQPPEREDVGKGAKKSLPMESLK